MVFMTSKWVLSIPARVFHKSSIQTSGIGSIECLILLFLDIVGCRLTDNMIRAHCRYGWRRLGGWWRKTTWQSHRLCCNLVPQSPDCFSIDSLLFFLSAAVCFVARRETHALSTQLCRQSGIRHLLSGRSRSALRTAPFYTPKLDKQTETQIQ